MDRNEKLLSLQNQRKKALGIEEDKQTASSGSISLQDLTEGENFRIIEDYMTDRFGMSSDKYDKQEIVDSYINNMRQFSFGQSVTTLQELAHLNRGDGSELDARRLKAGKAYSLFDSMQGVFGDERSSFGDKADAVYDYARALIVDPINVVSLGVGKLAATSATKAAGKVAQEAAKQAAKLAVKEAAEKGITSRVAIETAKREASRRAYTKALESAAYKSALKKSAVAEVAFSGGFDTGAAVGIEAVRQKAQMKAETMGDYDVDQLIVSAAGGIVGTGLSFGLTSMRGISNNTFASIELERSQEVTEAARALSAKEARAAQRKAAKELSESELQNAMDNDTILSKIDVVVTELEPFIDKVRRGLAMKYDDPENLATATDSVVARLFFLGDRKYGITGLVDILAEGGLPAWQKRSEKDTFTNYLGDVIRVLKPETRQKVDELFKDVFGKFDSPYAELGIEKFLDVDSAEISEGARRMQQKAAMNQILKNINIAAGKTANEVTPEEAIDNILDPLSRDVREEVAKFGEKLQQNFIKMLVTHPGTTALNAIGWSQATGIQTMSDMLRAPLYGGTAIFKALTGNQTKATEYGNLARQMVSLQKQKLANMVDPYMTYEAAMDYLTYRPEAQKEMFRYMVGGVEVDNVLKELGLPVGEKLTRTQSEKFMNFIQTAYGVKAQDFVTKTQEFMYAIDKRIRLEYGVSYQEFLKRDDLVEHLSEKGTDKYNRFMKIETAAVNDALRNVFSKRYGGSGGSLQRVAEMVENARKLPVVGAMIPFGQFFNNTLGFMFDHTGISLLHKFAVGTERDAMDLVTKSAIGLSLVGVAANYEMKNLEDGLAWYEERDETGAIRNRMYDFPLSFYKMAGRIAAHALRDGEVPQELLQEAKNTFGFDQLSRQLGDAAGTVGDMLSVLASGDLPETGKLIQKAFAESAAMYVSGYTRFADPANQILAMSRGEDYVSADRKQGSKTFNESIRYIDQFFAVAMGEDIAEEKNVATSGEAQGVPIGRLFGYREVLPQSTVQQLFNDIGRPQWMTGITSDSPEAVNAFNKFIFPILEMYADSLADSPVWKSLPLEQKQKQVKRILREAKKDSKAFLAESYDMEDNKVATIMKITDSNISKKEMRDALDIFDTSVDKLWELDLPQLQLIDFYISDRNNRQKLFEDTMGLK